MLSSSGTESWKNKTRFWRLTSPLANLLSHPQILLHSMKKWRYLRRNMVLCVRCSRPMLNYSRRLCRHLLHHLNKLLDMQTLLLKMTHYWLSFIVCFLNTCITLLPQTIFIRLYVFIILPNINKLLYADSRPAAAITWSRSVIRAHQIETSWKSHLQSGFRLLCNIHKAGCNQRALRSAGHHTWKPFIPTLSTHPLPWRTPWCH